MDDSHGFYTFSLTLALLGIVSTYITYYGHLEYLLYEENADGIMEFKGRLPLNFMTLLFVSYYTGAIFEKINIPLHTATVLEAGVRWKFQLVPTGTLDIERVPFYERIANIEIYNHQYGVVEDFKDPLNDELKLKGVPSRVTLITYIGSGDAKQRVTDGILEIEYSFSTAEGEEFFLLTFRSYVSATAKYCNV